MTGTLAQVWRIRSELTLFCGCLYYAALRPEEAVALRRAEVAQDREIGVSLDDSCVGPDLVVAEPARQRLERG